ncbi:MAG: radical SAM family heme chaperone HemW [Desulfovibrio sp.]|nr:radical SAM family heme chaperone HemW [Desulfovibrio sp.]
MLVYIHVPFCRTRCNYCAFHSVPLGRGVDAAASPQVRDYVDTLLMELALHADTLGGANIQSVFFGGGTPSLLPPRIVGVILDRLGRHFHLGDKTEITLEANPESLRGRNVVPDLLSAGVNRLSIGIQSLDEAMLRTLGRPHKAQDSLQAVFAAREAGCANISMDLMWGLPGQSVRQWLQTLKDAVRMSPDHISTYGLTLEPGTQMELECEEGRLVLPPERDQNIMFMEGAAYLEAQGYLHYEISNFARMGFQCRHNLGYWDGLDYLGLGPSATSTIAGRRWTNPASQRAWDNMVRTGALGKSPEVLTPTVRVLELIMLRLRTANGLRLKSYRELTGRDFLRDNQRLIQALHENGLIRIRNGYLRLTRSGMLVSNAIIANLFERTEAVLNREGLAAGDGNAVAPAPEGEAAQPTIKMDLGKGAGNKAASPEIRPVVWPTA